MQRWSLEHCAVWIQETSRIHCQIFWRNALMWRTLRWFSCRRYIVQDSLQYSTWPASSLLFFIWVIVDYEHAGRNPRNEGGARTLYNPAHHATSRKQHRWLTTPNIVGCYMLRPFPHSSCMLLPVVGGCCAKFETRWNLKLRANGRNSTRQCWELLANNIASVCTGFSTVFSVQDRPTISCYFKTCFLKSRPPECWDSSVYGRHGLSKVIEPEDKLWDRFQLISLKGQALLPLPCWWGGGGRARELANPLCHAHWLVTPGWEDGPILPPGDFPCLLVPQEKANLLLFRGYNHYFNIDQPRWVKKVFLKASLYFTWPQLRSEGAGNSEMTCFDVFHKTSW